MMMIYRNSKPFSEQHNVDVCLQSGGPDSVVPLVANPKQLFYALPEFDVPAKLYTDGLHAGKF